MGALDKLGRAHQETEYDAQERRIGQVARRQMHLQFRGAAHGCPIGPLFRLGCGHCIEAIRMAQILFQQGPEVLRGQLVKE